MEKELRTSAWSMAIWGQEYGRSGMNDDANALEVRDSIFRGTNFGLVAIPGDVDALE